MSKPEQSDRAFWLGVGQRYRVARLALGLTEEAAATAAGVPVRTWRKWERNGPRRAGHLGPLDFAAKFNVSIDWLFYGEGTGIGRHLAHQADGVVAILPRGKRCPLPKSVLQRTPSRTRPAQQRSVRPSGRAPLPPPRVRKSAG